jgi:PAS domain S-box-containing protein
VVGGPFKTTALADSVPDALIAVTAEGRVVLFNRAAERLYGYQSREVLGQRLGLLAAPGQTDQLSAAVSYVCASGEVSRLQLRQRQRDGAMITISAIVSPCGEDAAQRGATIVVRPLGVFDADEPYREVFEHCADAMGIFELGPAGHFVIVDVNQAYRQGAGLSREQLVGRSAAELLPAADVEVVEGQARECLARGAALEFDERRNLPLDQPVEQRLIHTMLVPLRATAGRARVLSISRDVTERKRADEASRKLSRAVEQSPVSIVITDRDGKIEYANPRFSQVTGYSVDEVRGQNPRIFKSGETSPQEYEALWHAISTGQEWRGEFHNRRKNGELYWESASISPVIDASGVITHFVAVKEDISETKRLQRELLQAQKMRAFAQLAAGIAHDFNNLLTVIQGNLSVVNSGGLTVDQAEAMVDVAKASKRAAELTKQLLTFSRRRMPTLTTIDLAACVRDQVKTLQRLAGEQVVVTAQTSASAPAWVLADRAMIEQVLVNLTLNSRDAMPRGGRLEVTVAWMDLDAEDLRRSPRARQGHFVRLTVRDTGTGIAPAVLARLFEPFFTTKELGKGSGLGLATVFGIVEQHQGWVSVESAVGQGTAVHVFFPRVVAKEEPKRPSGALVLLPKGGETILVVEDQPEVRAMVVRALSQAGYEVLDAASAAEGHAIWEKEIERVVLLVADVVMPGGASGRQLAERLQRRKPSLQVLYVSGFSDEAMLEELGRGALFLEKPFTPEELLRRVRMCLPSPSPSPPHSN